MANKAAAQAEKPKTTSEAKDKTAKGAPRPRKWDYGIILEAKIMPLVEEANVKRDIQKDWERVGKGTTCEKFFAAGGTRHGLRVMSRRKLISIVHADGSKFPVEYVKPEKPAKGEAKEPKVKQTQAERLGVKK